MPMSQVFDKLKAKGLLKPFDPRPIPNPLPLKFDVNKRCAYHQIPGHDTDHCFTLCHPITKTSVPGFEILLDCNNKVSKLKKEDTTWVPTDWADHMDPDAMTTLLGDHIYNIEEEEYWEVIGQEYIDPL